MPKPKTPMWVDPAFKRKIKREAADNDKSIVDFTKKLAEDEHEFENFIKIGKPNEKKRKMFNF